jgi:hypothetical protein
MAVGSTQPVTEMSTRNFRGGGGVKGGWPARKADNLTAIWELICLVLSLLILGLYGGYFFVLILFLVCNLWLWTMLLTFRR